MSIAPFKHFLVVSDFDQTLSFNDSGQILSELLGIDNFREKVDGLASSNFVQQRAELAYLVRHDPAFRGVRREHLVEAGQRVRLRNDISALVEFLKRGLDGFQFSFFVISAAPQEVIQAALDGIVPADHIIGTEFEYDPDSGEVEWIRRVPAATEKLRWSRSWRIGWEPLRTGRCTSATAAPMCT
jgi:2-hydroxy-3-keto-5-methylthiopentenyl-1-phosphate phosphatase